MCRFRPFDSTYFGLCAYKQEHLYVVAFHANLSFRQKESRTRKECVRVMGKEGEVGT